MYTNLIFNQVKSQNCYIASDNRGKFLKSYDSLIAFVDYDNNLVLSDYYAYSFTTGRHLHKFLRDNGFNDLSTKKAIEKNIKSGKIKLVKEQDLSFFAFYNDKLN